MKNFFKNTDKLFLLFALFVFTAASTLYVFYGRIHVDEGYYHVTPLLTMKGKLPYQDYLWVQGPLYPFVYAGFMFLFGKGVAAARFISVFFSLLTVIAAMLISTNLAGKKSLPYTCGLLCLNSFQIYYFTIIKLYSLTAFFLTAACLTLTSNLSKNLRYSLVCILLCFGAAVRIVIAPGIAAFCIFVFIKERKFKYFLLTVLISALTLIVLTAPFALNSPSQFFFGVIKYHMIKENFSPLQQIIFKFDSISSLLSRYFLTVLAISFVLVHGFIEIYWKKNPSAGVWRKYPASAIWTVMLPIAALHFTSQMPYTYRYLTVLFPVFAALAGSGAYVTIQNLNPAKLRRALKGVFITAAVMTFIMHGRKEISELKGSPIRHIKSAARILAQHSKPDAPVLTFNHSIAVEADRNVLPGYEMNVLTYNPVWTEEKCQEQNIINKKMLLRKIQAGIPGALFIYDFSFIGNFPVFYNPGEEGARPAVMKAIEQKYYLAETFPELGYLKAEAQLYLPKDTNR